MTEPAEAYNVEDAAELVITNVLRMLWPARQMFAAGKHRWL